MKRLRQEVKLIKGKRWFIFRERLFNKQYLFGLCYENVQQSLLYGYWWISGRYKQNKIYKKIIIKI
jgi:hypothetical protein